jgi:hypothetical protein
LRPASAKFGNLGQIAMDGGAAFVIADQCIRRITMA